MRKRVVVLGSAAAGVLVLLLATLHSGCPVVPSGGYTADEMDAERQNAKQWKRRFDELQNEHEAQKQELAPDTVPPSPASSQTLRLGLVRVASMTCHLLSRLAQIAFTGRLPPTVAQQSSP